MIIRHLGIIGIEINTMKTEVNYWFKATLRVKGVPHLHEEIKSILGPGTECHKQGDPVPDKPGKKWKNDIWLLNAPVPETDDINNHIGWIVDFASPFQSHMSGWKRAGATLDVYVAYACDENHRGFGLSSETLLKFAGLNMPLEFSILT